MNFHSVFFVIGLLTLGTTLVSLRREHIRTEYSVSWLAVGGILTALGEFPKLLGEAAKSLGVGPETCFLLVDVTLIAVLVFEISRVISRLRDENVMLAQRLAILEFQVRESSNRDGWQDT
jgi:hypothetical protein